ncbi:MAG: hypothetical protein A2782_02880 [Candidatus Blackburnbacteria bacterium RIFCSPHIGHO2_01_FULL_43_15b]|uniref:Glycosyltransferase 2-like domain-containing protein n=1 Tax=Candidatus Blackburnbacteria bacterium RIFCSPHIGHO2_01_FULL_43_15b TaxID=1797513 RepID=A0A1G1V334_9BACT|nr:MAG: hypothetical protein A2782_02880 [Candidatus Blackburnbacteria bacterium RIFCSPHIGHO2_01_FULL_43_15b]
MEKIRLSVVIPAYNESKNFRCGVLNGVVEFLKLRKYTWEVILVNDGSTDETLKLLKEFVSCHYGFRLVDMVHGGKVAAVTSGVLEARGEIVVFSDFDQSTPLSEVENFLLEFNKGAELVIGRRVEKSGWSLFQKLRSKTFNFLVQLIILPGINDTQCGFKAFKNSVAKELFKKLSITKHTAKDGYKGAFDVELLYLAKRRGYKIVQLPVVWSYVKSGILSPLEPIKMLLDIIHLRLAYLNRHVIPVVLLLLLSVPAWIQTAKGGYFPMHDDLQFGRQVVMDKCFADKQIPCRWSKDLGYGYGYPLFNYYPPFPYYLGQMFRSADLSYIDVIKVLVVLSLIISGLLMYLFAQVFWGKWGGLISGALYIYAPYHAVDIYVRGAMNEAWAIAFFPGVFWALYRLIERNKWKYVLPVAAFSSLVMLSHNLMLMLFVPAAFVWALFWLVKFRSVKALPKLVVSGSWSLGLAAFFSLPVIFEQKYAHVETLTAGYFNYLAHFATLKELFIDRNWGYGNSIYGPVDYISFQIGYIHWGLALVSLIVALVFARKKLYKSLFIVLMFAISLFYAFLAHEKSSFLWSAAPQLQYLQFPWRTLSIVIFGTSFLGGSIVILGEKLIKFRVIGTLILILVTVAFYKDYFRWKDFWPNFKDQDKLAGEQWKLQTTNGIFDYLPVWAPFPPVNPPNGDAEIIDGEGQITTLFKNSVKQEYEVKVKKEARFQINTFYFPGWEYTVDGREVLVNPKDDQELGRPRIQLSSGNYKIVALFKKTSVRYISDIVSVVSWSIFLVCAFLSASNINFLKREKSP